MRTYQKRQDYSSVSPIQNISFEGTYNQSLRLVAIQDATKKGNAPLALRLEETAPVSGWLFSFA